MFPDELGGDSNGSLNGRRTYRMRVYRPYGGGCTERRCGKGMRRSARADAEANGRRVKNVFHDVDGRRVCAVCVHGSRVQAALMACLLRGAPNSSR